MKTQMLRRLRKELERPLSDQNANRRNPQSFSHVPMEDEEQGNKRLPFENSAE
jgi:hypothetical protein